MANTKSAGKASRKIARRTEINKGRRSKLRSFVRMVEEAIAGGDRGKAMAFLQAAEARGEIVTGLIYLDADPEDLHAHLNTVTRPLNRLGEKELCPGSAALEKLNDEYR